MVTLQVTEEEFKIIYDQVYSESYVNRKPEVNALYAKLRVIEEEQVKEKNNA